jgi:nucleoside-diphosphate-sugar epimerase
MCVSIRSRALSGFRNGAKKDLCPMPNWLRVGCEKEIRMITILGAGGAIGNELVALLAVKNQPFRVVGRNPKATSGATETLAADLTDEDQTIRAVAGSSVVHLLVGLKYDHKLWREMWPRVTSNAIEACNRAGAKLLFFDNVYMYGKVRGPMTEEPACSQKVKSARRSPPRSSMSGSRVPSPP